MNLSDDRIYRFLESCYSAGIKCPERFLTDKMPRVYSFLKGAFPRGILPTDVDGEVEINGQFLRLEFKHEDCLRNGRVPKGQIKCFQSLCATGLFTVFYVGHDEFGETTLMHVWKPGGGTYIVDPCNNARLREACSSWSRMAESQKRKLTP